MIKSILPLLAMGVFALGVIAGCGGDGNSDSAAGSAEKAFVVQADTTMETGKLPKPRFIRFVNATCREAWEIVLDNFAKYRSWQDKTRPNGKRFSQAIRVSLMAGIDFHIFDNIHFLGAPKGEEREVEDIIGQLQEAVERGQRLGPLHSVAEVTALFSDYNRLADRYGLDDCLVNRAHAKI